MATRRRVSTAVMAAVALGLAVPRTSAADLGAPRLHHHHHRHVVIVEPPVVPLGYAYGGYGNGVGPGWELSGEGPGYGYGFAPGWGYLGPGIADEGLDLGY